MAGYAAWAVTCGRTGSRPEAGYRPDFPPAGQDVWMRIIIWHGYLLNGTGSNVYTRMLARTWRRSGHDVVVICQDPPPEDHDLLGARVVRPDIGPLLPVFVLDGYEDVEPRL